MMRIILAMVLAFALVAPAFAKDRWHRNVDGGQDLSNDSDVVVGMVRHDHANKTQWVALIGKEIGSEEWVLLGKFPLMREAKKAIQEKVGVDSEDD